MHPLDVLAQILPGASFIQSLSDNMRQALGFIMGKRFRVAFSFAGEKRSFVSAVAEILADVFGQEAILYDKYHEAEFAARKLGLKLPNLYYKETDLIVTVFCPVYDKKLWTGLEWTAIHAFMVDNHDDDVLLARFDFAEVEGLYKTAGFIELDDKTPKEFATLILQRLALNEGLPRDHYLKSRTSSASPKGDWRIPVATSFFTGQEEYMTQIGEKLAEGKAVKIGQAIHLSGFGGVGKTALALEYAQQNQGKYENGYFLRCETADTLTESLVEIGGGSMTGSPEEIAAYAEQGLVNLAKTSKALVILDNADVLLDADKASDLLRRTFETTRKHHLLVTARPDAVYDGLEPLAVESMGPEVGGLFFYRLWKNAHDAESVPVSDQEACQDMSKELGGLPLALEQAGRMANRRKLRPDELVKDFQKRREEILKATPMAHNQISQWVTVEAILDGLSDAAKDLAFLLAFMSPDHVDERLFTEWEMELPDDLRDAVSAEKFDLVRDELLEAVLCKRVNEEDPYRVTPTLRSRLEMHRAVQAVIQEIAGDQKAEWWWNGGGWAAFALLSQSRFYEGLPHGEIARLAREASLGSEHPDLVRDLNNLAQLLQATNRMGEAEPLMLRALQIDERCYGSEHPNVARNLNNLAWLLQSTNRMGEAEPLMLRALQINEKSYGPEHPDVARSLNNLALLLRATNRISEAEPLLRRALRIDEKSYGPEHPEVAIDINNLASLFYETNRMGEAEPLMRRALRIDEKNYGPEHPNIARGLNNLATLLQSSNRTNEAEPLMRRALEIDEKSYGSEHPSVANRLNNLAMLLQSSNRTNEAEPLMGRVLGIYEKSLGPEHPNVAISLNNLAQLFQKTNHMNEAEPLLRRALLILIKSLGFEHPYSKTILKNFIELLTEMGKSQDEIRAELEAVLREAGIEPPF